MGTEMYRQSTNPFTFKDPISDPDRFFGRQREVEQVFSRLLNPEAESSSLVGSRRIGKTSLLKYLAHPEVRRRHGLDPNRFNFIYIDLRLVHDNTTPSQLWGHILGQMARHCKPPEVKFLIKKLRTSGEIEYIDTFILADVFDAIDEERQHIVLLLDEFEHVTKNVNFGANFFYNLRSLAIQHNLSLITSSRQELIELTHSEEIRSSPFFNIFANINLRLLREKEALRLITSSLTKTEVTFTESEIEAVLRLAGPYPHFLQTACYYLFDAYEKGVYLDERLKYVEKRFALDVAPHFEYLWNDSNNREQIAFMALAMSAHQDPYGNPSRDLRELESLYSRSRQTLDRLVKRALVIKDQSGYSLFSMAFSNWLVESFSDAASDAFGYETWLESNRQELDKLNSNNRRAIRQILPLVDDKYRDLIINWMSNSGSPKKVADLLKNALIDDSGSRRLT